MQGYFPLVGHSVDSGSRGAEDFIIPPKADMDKRTRQVNRLDFIRTYEQFIIQI